MKKIFILCSFLIIGAGMVIAQDVITKRNGEDINAKILEVTQTEIKYKKFDNQTGPTFSVGISEIFMVKYENGTKDVFDKTPQQSLSLSGGNRNSNNTAPLGVEPGMPYKYYKGLYKNRRYVPQPGDQYNPAISGLCSFFVPGLGQMISGEIGRGFGFFGGAAGCYALMGIGAGLSTSSSLDDEDDGQETVGAILMLAGAAGSLTISICSIFDAIKVAKIKNMYGQDINRMTSAMDLKLSPYFETVSIGSRQVTPVGFKLSMSF